MKIRAARRLKPTCNNNIAALNSKSIIQDDLIVSKFDTLKKRKISTKNVEIGLNELDDEKYLKKFEDLFTRKLERYIYKIDIYSKKKIFDYFKYRGWENDMVFNKINALKWRETTYLLLLY